MERVFRRALVAFRWGALLWLISTLWIYRDDNYIRHWGLAIALVAAAVAFTVLQTSLIGSGPGLHSRRTLGVIELAFGVLLMALDGYVRKEGVVFSTQPSLGSWWPVAGLLSASTYFPVWGAALGGLSFGLARTISTGLNGTAYGSLDGGNILSLLNTSIFATLAAVSVSYFILLMRRAQDQLALAQAREEVARTLHDGVLQTLAVVERRTEDQNLKQLARDQERELRLFLFGQRDDEGVELGTALLECAARFEQTFGATAQVIVAFDVPEISKANTYALVGAVREALTNAGKHGHATSVTIYVEPGDESGVFCSIKDDGVGFDVERVEARVGLSRSIKGRIEDVQGSVDIRSSAETGTEVLLWVP